MPTAKVKIEILVEPARSLSGIAIGDDGQCDISSSASPIGGYGWHGQLFKGIDIRDKFGVDRTKHRLPAIVNEHKRDT